MSLPRVLVLSSAEDEESTAINNSFIDKLHQQVSKDIEIEWCNYHAIHIELSQGRVVARLADDGTELREFDFVYFKSFFRYSELAGVIAAYLEATDTRYVGSELKNHIPLTKLSQLSRLAHAGLPIAKTLFMLHDQWMDSYKQAVDTLGSPFIFKSTDGSGGDENYLVRTEKEFLGALRDFPSLQFIAQQYIENDSDLRVLIVGGEVKLIIKRQRSDLVATHLNNTSQGAGAVLVPVTQFSSEHRTISLEAANIMQREIAGVDLLFELGTGLPYILEVNASPQIGSGAFTGEKLAIYSEYFVKMTERSTKLVSKP